MKCLNLSDLIARQTRLLRPPRQQQIEDHLQSCSTCKRKLVAYDGLKELVWRNFSPSRPSETEASCDELQIVSYVEGTVRKKSRTEFQRHLTQCESCLDRLVAVERLLTELKGEGLLPIQPSIWDSARDFIAAIRQGVEDKLRTAWHIMTTPKPAFRWAGAAIVLIVVVLVFRPVSREENFITREPVASQSTTGIQLLNPANRSSVLKGTVEFLWQGPSHVVSYNFLLLDANGNIVWENKTREQKMVLPPEIQLQPSQNYFWQVEGLPETGGSIVSDMSSFSFN